MSAARFPALGAADVARLLRAAAWAPSGDNTQPWRLAWDAARGAVEIALDPARDASPLNAGQQMALIACGAAVENVCRLAAALGLRPEVEQLPAGALAAPTPVARVALAAGGQAGDAAAVERLVESRVTNRRPYDGRPLEPAVLAGLERATAELPGADAFWVTDRALLRRFAGLVARSDAVMFGEHAMRRAFLGNVRFDLPWNASPDLGLSPGSLEADLADRLALRAMRVMPDGLFALSGGARLLGRYSRRLVRGSSGLCLVVQRGDGSVLDLGRAAERVWLALTEAGLAAQPMMSLPGLRFALAHGPLALARSLDRLGAPAVLRRLGDLLAAAGVPAPPGFILRFGSAPPPTCRVLRQAP